MSIKVFTANPTKLSPAPCATHVIAGAILCDRCLAFGTLCNEQIPRNCWVKSIEFTAALVPGLVTLEATFVGAHSAGCFTLASTFRPSDHPLAVCCSAPLQIFVLAYNDVLIDRLVHF